jgi:hypothetical protein
LHHRQAPDQSHPAVEDDHGYRKVYAAANPAAALFHLIDAPAGIDELSQSEGELAAPVTSLATTLRVGLAT